MRILLNGERRDLPGPRTVRTLLDDLGIDARMVAVEVNRAVIRRDRHDLTPVPDGAEVEIVSFVGGGRKSKPGFVSAAFEPETKPGFGRPRTAARRTYPVMLSV